MQKLYRTSRNTIKKHNQTLDKLNLKIDIKKNNSLPYYVDDICETSATCSNSLVSSPNAECNFNCEFTLEPVVNSLDVYRRNKLGWHSGEELDRHRYFDAIDIIDVFESLIQLKNFYDSIATDQDDCLKTYKKKINDCINIIAAVKCGESLLKFAELKHDADVPLCAFEDVAEILRLEPDFINIAIYLPVVLPGLLFMGNLGYKENVIYCKAGIFRVLNSKIDANQSVKQFLLKKCLLFPEITEEKLDYINNEIVATDKKYAYLNPLTFINSLNDFAADGRVVKKVTFLNETVNNGYIINNKKANY